LIVPEVASLDAKDAVAVQSDEGGASKCDVTSTSTSEMATGAGMISKNPNDMLH
jgi:hypothetical protein